MGSFYWSTNLISILELSIYVLTISTFAYFSSGQHAIDNYTINWNRYGQYTLSVWLLCLYAQSLGHLIGVLVMRSATTAVVISIMIYTVMDITNDFLFKSDEFKSDLLVMGSNLIGLKYITKYVIYIIYGIDRCNKDWTFR